MLSGESPNVANQVVEVCKDKQIVGHLTTLQTKGVHISLAAQKCRDFEENKKKLLFPKLQQFEAINNIILEIDIRTVSLKKDISFSISGKHIYNGAFLPDGTMIFPQYTYVKAQCLLFERNGKQIKQIMFVKRPSCARNVGEEIFITSGSEKNIDVISSKTFQHIRSFSVNKICFGLDVFNNHLYIASSDSIEVMDKSGNLLQSYGVEKSVECVIVTKQGNIVYSTYDKDLVTAMNDKGNTSWTYTRPNLRFPYGLEKDSKDNVYIAGRDSNNIHVISRDGAPLRVFDDIDKPWFTMIPPDDDSVCCICSDKTMMTLYRMI